MGFRLVPSVVGVVLGALVVVSAAKPPAPAPTSTVASVTFRCYADPDPQHPEHCAEPVAAGSDRVRDDRMTTYPGGVASALFELRVPATGRLLDLNLGAPITERVRA